MRRIFSLKLVPILVLAFTSLAIADQLENEAHEQVPKGVLVKVDPATKTVEVFKAPVLSSSILNNTATADETRAAINAVENAANKIAEVTLVQKELDKDSSTEAWRYRWYGYNGFGYNGYGYRNWGWNNWGGYYRPYYYNWYSPYSYYPGYFNYGYSNYNYGWNYGYNNCYYGWYY